MVRLFLLLFLVITGPEGYKPSPVIPSVEQYRYISTENKDGNNGRKNWITRDMHRQLSFKFYPDSVLIDFTKQFDVFKKVDVDKKYTGLVPKNILDFRLEGIYRKKDHPVSYMTVIYRSRSGKGLILQYHDGLGHVDLSLFYSNTPENILAEKGMFYINLFIEHDRHLAFTYLPAGPIEYLSAQPALLAGQ